MNHLIALGLWVALFTWVDGKLSIAASQVKGAPEAKTPRNPNSKPLKNKSGQKKHMEENEGVAMPPVEEDLEAPPAPAALAD